MINRLEISALLAAFESGARNPATLLDEIYDRITAEGTRPVWIELLPRERAHAMLQAALERRARGQSLPLLGVPFAIKDNIDLAGVPTTAACPSYSYVPERDSSVVARLIAAGAIPIGKTNMDQFATGLVGTRSPYGACSSVYNPTYIAGGSSSGSAVAVAQGLVAFALGTDTAGSGRVPAAFNNLVGIKPTRGLLSTRGLVPACRSLDCVSVFANSVNDAALVAELCQGFDAEDPYSRTPQAIDQRRAGAFAVPKAAQLEWFGNTDYPPLFQAAIRRCEALGLTKREVDMAPFFQAAQLLYGGPWVAERYAAVGAFLERESTERDGIERNDVVNPVVREIVLEGKKFGAVATFQAQYALAALYQQARSALAELDFLLLPTTPTQYTLAEIATEPVLLNKRLGYYTNFVNLLDLACVAVPAGFTPAGLPFGVTLMGPAFSDRALQSHAAALLGERTSSNELPIPQPTPATVPQPSEILLAVAGAHLSGQPLNFQLTQRGARLVNTTRTSPEYKLYALAGTVPPKPGVVFTPGFNGPGIEVEIWALVSAAFGSFVSEVPQPMVIGTATLSDGSKVKSFLCEPFALNGATDITSFGGWRGYLAATSVDGIK
jgi:allophanate hydrolase